MDRYEALRVLGLNEGASDKQIDAAYRNAAKTAHPDAGGSSDEFRILTEAKDLLSGNTLSESEKQALARELKSVESQIEAFEARVVHWDPADPRIPKMLDPLRARKDEILKKLGQSQK
jgi:curved DNA-binding protein CbpA